jgi:hypothetical protein
MKKISIKAITIVFFSLIIFSPIVNASGEQSKEKTTDQIGKEFSVKIKENEMQLEEKLPYFNYKVEEGKTYTNVYILRNSSEQEKTIDIKPVNAFTNPYASLNFSSEEETEISNFIDEKRKFANYVKGPTSVILAPKEEKEVSLEITTPEGLSNGEVIGGIVFEEQNQLQGDDDSTGTSLQSKINFITSTLLEFETKVAPKIEFGEVLFKTQYAVPRIEAEVINRNGNYLKESTVLYTVKNKENEVLFEGKKDITRFAPSTNVYVPIQLELEELKAGEYLIDLNIVSKNNEFQQLKETKTFEITNEMLKIHQVDFGEEKIIPEIQLGSPLAYILILLVGIAGIGSGMYFMKRKYSNINRKEDQ